MSRVMDKPYRSPRSLAWRNALVAATNAGLEQGLFSLRPGETCWSEDASPHGVGFSFMLGGNVPAFALVRDAGYDELEIKVALWLRPGADEFIVCSNAGFREADVIATGWIERRRDAWLQSSPNLFRCRKRRVGELAAVAIEPHGYCDHGELII
jgi:hypothetical protein